MTRADGRAVGAPARTLVSAGRAWVGAADAPRRGAIEARGVGLTRDVAGGDAAAVGRAATAEVARGSDVLVRADGVGVDTGWGADDTTIPGRVPPVGPGPPKAPHAPTEIAATPRVALTQLTFVARSIRPISPRRTRLRTCRRPGNVKGPNHIPLATAGARGS